MAQLTAVFHFQSPPTWQWPCNNASLSFLFASPFFQSPLTGQWPCNGEYGHSSTYDARLSVPSNGAMALQRYVNVKFQGGSSNFQSPLTGQWPCNSNGILRILTQTRHFQSPLTGQWPCNAEWRRSLPICLAL